MLVGGIEGGVVVGTDYCWREGGGGSLMVVVV